MVRRFSRVKRRHVEPRVREEVRRAIALVAGPRVHDADAVAAARARERRHVRHRRDLGAAFVPLAVANLHRLPTKHLVLQVGTVQRRTNDARVAKTERVDDVSLGATRRRRRERLRRREGRDVVAEIANAEVRRAEIVSPLRRAVRLVHREPGDVAVSSALGEGVAESGREERLGRRE